MGEGLIKSSNFRVSQVERFVQFKLLRIETIELSLDDSWHTQNLQTGVFSVAAVSSLGGDTFFISPFFGAFVL